MKINVTCPCCSKNIQVILSNIGSSDISVTGVFFNKEHDDLYTTNNNQEELKKELFEKQNILIG